jgi:hypothetical protein
VKPNRESSFLWLTFSGAAISTIGACWFSWIFFISPMDQAIKTGNRIKEGFEKSLGITPRILANAGAIFAQNASQETLICSERRITVQSKLEAQPPSWNALELQAEFHAEAGIFTREIIEINIHRGGALIGAALPPSKVLSLHIQNPKVANPSETSWDSLPEKAQIKATQALQRAAKKQLIEEGFLVSATQSLQNKIRAIASEAGCKVEFVKPSAP